MKSLKSVVSSGWFIFSNDSRLVCIGQMALQMSKVTQIIFGVNPRVTATCSTQEKGDNQAKALQQR
jgi:hypothetical protein